LSEQATTQIVTPEQYEAALATILHFKQVAGEMRDNEARQSSLRKDIARIGAPILAKAHTLTADLRAEKRQIEDKIEDKEKPYKDEASEKTRTERKEASDLRERMTQLRAALYGAVG
jgi:septal ring factor EnvC (AmiA/AmiB activator)